MPSPVGHLLAGVATSWIAERIPQPSAPRASSVRWTAACAFLAASPDLDLLFSAPHRTATHSVGAALLVTIIAGAVTGWVTGRFSWRVALTGGAAYASHILLDWLGSDPNPPAGIQAFWPFTLAWYISPWTVFSITERRHFFTATALATNVRAILTEVAIMAPLMLVLGWARGSTWKSRIRNRN